MARPVAIGDYESQVPVQEGLRRIVPEVRPGQGGSALEQLGAAAIQAQRSIDIKDAAVYVSKESANSRVAAEQVFQDRRNRSPDELAQDGGFTPSVVKGFRETTQEALKQAPNPIARQMMQEHLNQIGANLEIRAREQDAQDRHVQKIATLTEAARTAATAAELNPNAWQQIAEDQHGAQANAGLDPEENARMSAVSHDLISEGAGRGLAKADPRGALQRLNDPKDPLFGAMTLEGREHVRAKANEHLGDLVFSSLDGGDIRGAQIALNHNEDVLDPKTAHQLQSTINAQSEHQIVMADKMQRDASNSLLKNAIKMSMDGTLTPKYIEQHHNTWEPAAYEYAYKLLSGKEAVTDPHTFAPLLSRAMGGQDVTQEAQEALYSNKLTLPDYDKIVQKSESPRKGYVARGAEYITTSLKPSQLVSDPAGQRSTANALSDWHDWTVEHPNAEPAAAEKMYKSITDHYQIISSDKATVFMPVPLQLVGSRLQPDIPATWAATKQARDAGEMSEAEYQRQAFLINQWLAATAKKAPPVKAP